MKLVAYIAISLVPLLSAASARADEEGILTFRRPGDMGVLNICPASVTIEGECQFTIIGERSVTLRLPKGKYRVRVESADPYDSTAGKWTTGPVEVLVSDTESVYAITGGSASDGLDHWDIRKIQPNQSPEPTPGKCPLLRQSLVPGVGSS